ncbi:hypothetical protein Tco_1005128 [Tanacetum coccineum]|uniref:Uncharacterized protein n=1 Tax=Tanacetum coccineum TaxID=301880 RepID=A0ABQ5FE70_9ASTR
MSSSCLRVNSVRSAIPFVKWCLIKKEESLSNHARGAFSHLFRDPFLPGNKYDNFDPEADLRKIEYLLNREPSTESSLKSDIEIIDPILERFTDEPAHVYSPPPGDDDDDNDDLFTTSLLVLPTVEPESKDTSGNDKECDCLFVGGNSMNFSNPLFDSNDDFTSSDDESLPEEDVQEENFKIYSNPLFEFNEVLEDIESKDSCVSNLDELALIVTPLSEANEDECFDPGGDVDKIDAIDVSTDIEDGYHDSEEDIIYL